MQLTISTANCTGNQKNCLYPNKRVVTSVDELKEAVKVDHVCAEYENNYRSADKFIKSDVIVNNRIVIIMYKLRKFIRFARVRCFVCLRDYLF